MEDLSTFGKIDDKARRRTALRQKGDGFAWIAGTASLAFTISIFFLNPGIFAIGGGQMMDY